MLLKGCQNVLYVNPKSLYVSPAFTADQLLESPHSADTLTHWPTLQQTKWCAVFQYVRPLSLQSPNLPIQDGLPAAVQVVKLLLGDGVIDIHGGHTQLPSFGQLVEPAGQSRNISKRRVLSCQTQAGADLWTPVTLSSTMPLIFLNTLGYFLYIQWVRSPPSSRI